MRALPVVLAALGVAAMAGLASCGTSVTAGATAAAGATAGSQSAVAGRAKLRVVATTTQVADFTRNVGGDRVRLNQLLKPNIDPHDYEASPADVQAVADADLLVVNGVGLESGWLDPTAKAAGFRGIMVDTSTGIAIRNAAGESGDPHIWHDPRNAIVMVAGIERALAKADPEDSAFFAANAASYTAKLQALDADIAAKIASLPAADRKLVTNHDAFGYYAARYGFAVVGSVIPSFDTSAGLSGSQLNELTAKIKATGTRAIFSESSLPPNAAEALAKQAHVAVEAGADSLYGDTLGPVGSQGATYLQMEEHNTDTIVRALTP